MHRLGPVTMAAVGRIQIETACGVRASRGQLMCDHDQDPIVCIEALRFEKVNCVVCTLTCEFYIRRVT